MHGLIEFLQKKYVEQTALFSQLKCSVNEAELLKILMSDYLAGTTEVTVFSLLAEAYKKERIGYVTHIVEVRNLIELGWVTINGQHHGKTSDIILLDLLHQSISLSITFLKLVEDGNLDIRLPEVKPYADHLEYLQDNFLRIDLYQKLAQIRQNYDPSTQSFTRVKNRLMMLEKQIKKRIAVSKESPRLERYFKERHLNEKERVIFFALLKEEYSGTDENLRDMNTLIEIVSFDDYEKIKNRSLLEENAPLIEKGIIGYDEVLTPFGSMSRSFFISEEVLKEIVYSKKKKNQRIKLDTLIKEQEIFELIDPRTTLDDVVLNSETREIIELLLKRMDTQVIKRLKEWGIKDKKGSTDSKIMFHGHPGTGKTLTAVSIAKTLKKQVISFDCSKILSMYVGESEKNARRIFDTYKDIVAKSKTEPILLLNEADQFLSSRTVAVSGGAEKMHNQMQNIFLEQIERFDGILIATTNLLENIDPAFSRRFDYKIKFEKPNASQRLEIWKKLMPTNAPFETGFNLETLAKYQLTGAQISLAIKNAAMIAAVQEEALFTNEIFESVIKKELSGAFGEEKTLGFLS
ncbi:MAG: ATP-binding protein [Helicobacteraceae bacterium]|jgi:SpoVK/Ycf46/Vps4 family AAA+-type ATPase|nr:ATP-binding protein [Helicobacteraceae bacterium]